MAFTPQELDIIKQVKNQGGTIEQARGVISKIRAGGGGQEQVEKPGFVDHLKSAPGAIASGLGENLSSAGSEIASGLRGIGSDIYRTAHPQESVAMGVAPEGGLAKSAENLQGRADSVKASIGGYRKGEQNMFDTGMQVASEAVGTILDPSRQLGEAAISAAVTDEQADSFKDLAKYTVENSDIAKGVVKKAGEVTESYEGLKETDPGLARNIKAGAGFGESFLDAVGVKVGGKGVKNATTTMGEKVVGKYDIGDIEQGLKDAGTKVQETAKGFTDSAGNAISKTKEFTGDVVSSGADKIKDKANSVTSGLTPEQIKGFQSNPYQKEEFQKLTERIDSPEGIDDIKNYKTERVGAVTTELTEKIDEIRTTKGETSKAYQEVRKSTAPVSATKIQQDIEGVLKKKGMDIVDGHVVRKPGIAAGEINPADVSKFDQLLQDIKADSLRQGGVISPSQALDFRKTASNLAKYDANTTSGGQAVMKEIRRAIDKTAKEEIPGLKELDAQFVDKLDEFENAVKDLVYKGGDVKGEWRSNIVNIVGTLDRQNRAKLLGRLEEVLPGIKERIEAINNLPTTYKALSDSKLGNTLLGAGTAAVGFGTGGPLGAVVGYMLGKGLDTSITAVRKKSITKVLSKVSKEGKARLAEINKKIEKNQNLNKMDKIFINNLKKDVTATEKSVTNIQKTNSSGGINKPTNNDTRGSVGNSSRNDSSNGKTRLALPQGQKKAIVTPQTKKGAGIIKEKAVIAESKKDLSKAKIRTPTTKKEVKSKAKEKKAPIKKESAKSTPIKTPKKESKNLAKDNHDGKQMPKSEYRVIGRVDGEEIKEGKTFTYIGKDKYLSADIKIRAKQYTEKFNEAGGVGKITKMETIEIIRELEEVFANGGDHKKRFSDIISKKAKNSLNKGGYIAPGEILKDIKSLAIKTPATVKKVSDNIIKSLGVAKTHTKEAYKIVERYVKKYGVELKDKIGELLDELADKIPGVKSKFMADGGKSLDDLGKKQTLTVYQGRKGTGKKKEFPLHYFAETEDVAKSYGPNVSKHTIKVENLADFTKVNKELRQLLVDNYQKNFKEEGLGEFYVDKALKENNISGTPLYEILEDPKVTKALKEAGYDSIKYEDIGGKNLGFKKHNTIALLETPKTPSSDLIKEAKKYKSADEFITNYFKNESPIITSDKTGINRTTLKSIIKAPELYKKYPSLNNADVVLTGRTKGGDFAKGTAKYKARLSIGKNGWEEVYDEAKKIGIERKMDNLTKSGKPDSEIETEYLRLESEIENLKPIGKRINEEGLRILTHELEHAKQELKGHKFTSQDGLKDFDEYYNLPEEVEARAAESKFVKTHKQLKEIYKQANQ